MRCNQVDSRSVDTFRSSCVSTLSARAEGAGLTEYVYAGEDMRCRYP